MHDIGNQEVKQKFTIAHKVRNLGSMFGSVRKSMKDTSETVMAKKKVGTEPANTVIGMKNNGVGPQVHPWQSNAPAADSAPIPMVDAHGWQAPPPPSGNQVQSAAQAPVPRRRPIIQTKTRTKFAIEQAPATPEESRAQKVVCLENMYLVVRFIGSCIVAADIILKFMYFQRSKFASYYLKDIYYYFLCMRPLLLLGSNLYNFLLNCKNSEKVERKLKKKYKDDVAW